MNPRKFLSVAAFGLVLFFPLFADGAEKVRFAVDWVHHGGHSGFWSALDRGLFSKAGLEVSIDRGFGSDETTKRVAANALDLGFSDAGTVIMGRAKGMHVKSVAVLYNRSQYAILTLGGSGIEKPKDLEGRLIGVAAGAVTIKIFPALAAANQVDMKKIRFEPMQPAVLAPSLLGGKVDAVSAFASSGIPMRAAAAKEGKTLRTILWSDFGLDLYSNGIVVTDATIASKPEMVRRFLEAALRGTAWAIEHPEEAVQIFHKYHPEKTPGLSLQEWRHTLALMHTDETKKTGLGFMTLEKMKHTRDVLAKYVGLEREVEVKDVYTNEFLTQVIPSVP